MILGYIASLLIGGTLGFFGAGGSILTVPVLVYLFQVDVALATTYSLFIVGASSSFGVVANVREKTIDVRTALLFGIPSLIAVFFTRKFILPAIPDEILKIGGLTLTKDMFLLMFFAVLMILASYSMIHKSPERAAKNTTSSDGRVMFEGVFIGLVTALVGAGGGFLIVPVLVNFVKLPMKIAIGTSLLIATVNSLAGFVFSLGHFTVDWSFLLVITTIAIIGIVVGNWLSSKVSSAHLKTSFGWFILVMGVVILANQLMFS